MTTFGEVLLVLAAISALMSVAALAWGHWMGEKEGESTTNMGYLATFGVLLFATGAVLVLAVAFFTQNFTFQYVAENHTTDISSLRWLYQLSGVWAGREGSLLFWEWLLACFAGWVAYKRLQVTDQLSNVALAVTNVIQLFFLAALFIDKNNPFKAVQILADGSMVKVVNGAQQVVGNINQSAMNPLLQHWAMIAHPPTLFIGYAGLTIPFAFAVAALILNDGSKRWVELSHRITVFAWLFLGIGIGLGAIWAYVELGWGGYWGWDPVENASLLPWLTGVALLHSMTLYKRRESFKGWAVVLSGLSFALVVLATFITRSGVVESVHAFEKDPLSLYLFLTLMIGSFAATAVGLLLRRKGGAFAAKEEFESLTSREAAYYFNNVIMTVAALLVAYLTVSSAVPAWLPFGGQKFAAAAYDNIARPVGIVYVLILVLCPILAWRKTEGPQLWSRLKTPLIGGSVLAAGLVGLWYTLLRPIDAANRAAALSGTATAPPPLYLHNAEAVLGLVVAAYAIAMPLYLFWAGANARAKAKGESFGTAIVNILTKARSQSGGYLAHLGVGIILVGLVGSAMFVQDVRANVPQKGGKFEVGGYQLQFVRLDETTLKNNDQMATGLFNVVKGGAVTGQVRPAILYNAVSQQTTRNVAIIHEPLRDVFIVMEGVDNNGELTMTAKINPLISFTWVGFVLLIGGATLAVWPRKEAAAVARQAAAA